MLRIAILYNEPVLPADHADYASEAGVLESVEAFAAVLEQARHAVARLGIGGCLEQVVARLSAERPDVVVNFCEGFAGHSGGESYMTGVLELLGLPYTGSPPECLALVRNKLRTKQALAAAGIAAADYWFVRHDDNLESLPYALDLHNRLAAGNLFVKPAAEDASLGIDEHSVVNQWSDLAGKVSELQSRYGDVLVEEYLDGREFNVGVIALPDPEALPIAEIEFQTNAQFRWPILTYASKWTAGSAGFQGTPVRCPSAVDDATAARIEQTALAAFAATGCRDYARIDLRLTSKNELYVLEVNANPDAGPSAGLVRALGAAGILYSDFIHRLIKTAAQRRPQGPVAGHASPSVHAVETAAETPLAGSSTKNTGVRPLEDGDHQHLLEILAACAMFRSDEIDVADEILHEALRDGATGHYQVFVAEAGGRPVGWSCHGRVPLTDATYDLYWIAVHPAHQGRRVGRALLGEIERTLQKCGARWLLAETSTLPLYEKTRAFYERTGFRVVGEVPDFYRREDGRITFGKRLAASSREK